MTSTWAAMIALLPLASSDAPAAAQSPDPAQIVRGLCQKDGCAELSVLEKQPAGQGPDGQLFRTRIAIYHADSAGRASQGEQDGFIYCSKTRPAVLSATPGQPVTAFLFAPDDMRPAWQQRSSVNFVAIYFTVCHGLDAGRAAARDRAGVARGLGYAGGADQDRTVRLGSPQEILRGTPPS